MDLNELSLASALRAVERGECSAEEVAQACLRRIATEDEAVGAWHWLDEPTNVLDRVRAVPSTTALRGLLYGVKDTIDTAEMPTEYGSPLYAGHQPTADAAPIAALTRAGGVAVGKTVATEFAYFAPGRTVNPHNRERSPGGSSSGSAAAVADYMVPFALGSQTAGSVIRPASYCGCVGYVASHGGLPTAGVHPLSPSLDSLGVLAREVDDVVIVRNSLLRRPITLRKSLGAAPVRLAICDGRATGPIDPEMADALTSATLRLEAGGATVVPLGLDDAVSTLTVAHLRIMAFEAARSLAGIPKDDELVSESLRELIATGWATSEDQYRDARADVRHAASQLTQVLGRVDAIVAPSAPGAAPPLEATGSPHASRPWQALGLPAVSLPFASAADGMPLGLQLIGQRDRDDELLALASWALGVSDRPSYPSTIEMASARRTGIAG